MSDLLCINTGPIRLKSPFYQDAGWLGAPSPLFSIYHLSYSIILVTQKNSLVILQHTTPLMFSDAPLLLDLSCHLVPLRHMAAAPALAVGQQTTPPHWQKDTCEAG
jgi:hypothetical protein